ncbi:MAG: (d)CMP kinase [Gemmatimonadota bacterium]|jgi:cytidylate kinase
MARAGVVTIDGPAGSGKSTTARAVARKLGFRHLDSGALYRAIACALLSEHGEGGLWETLTEEELSTLPLSIHARGGTFEIRLGEQVLGPELRTEAVTSHASRLARLPAVRGALLDLQRSAGQEGGLVADGRDMGTVVFPDADVKVFLVADLEERARRRLLERTGSEPEAAEIRNEAEIIARRDRRDSERAHAPLRKPQGALEIDTTRLTFEEQVRAVVDLARRRLGDEGQNR